MSPRSHRATQSVGALLAAVLLLVATPAARAGRGATAIDLCCAWGAGIADGITFRVDASDAAARDVIRRGVESWASAVNGTAGVRRPLVLREVKRGRAEVTVRYNRAGTNIQGQTRRSLRGGMLRGATITVFGSYLGKRSTPEVIGQIAKHEVGHALGAGHADGDGHVMSPTVVSGREALTECDVDAVIEANRWFLVDGAEEPSDPARRVRC